MKYRACLGTETAGLSGHDRDLMVIGVGLEKSSKIR